MTGECSEETKVSCCWQVNHSIAFKKRLEIAILRVGDSVFLRINKLFVTNVYSAKQADLCRKFRLTIQ